MDTSNRRIVYNTDCEGPTVRNDNAYEAACHFIPRGQALFEQLSLFDDYTAYVKKRPQYNAGDTLRLLLPFLKAVGVTDIQFAKWTHRKGAINWVDGAKEAVAFAREQNLKTYEISASYRPFAARVASEIKIPAENIYCTDLNLDRFEMTQAEAQRVSEIAEAIVELPKLSKTDIRTSARRVSKRQQDAFDTCDRLIWDKLATEPCSAQILSEVRAMGGTEKRAAIFDAIRRAGSEPSDAVYVADSITDVEAFRELRRRGGVTIAFNGNEYAVKAAEYATWGRSSLVNAVLLAVFVADRREGLTRFCDSGGKEKSCDKIVVTVLNRLEETGLPWGCARVSERNLGLVMRKSERFRKETRESAASLS